ncbi:MAG: alanine--glyoxylate aminotransferase family protein [Chloroflexota bacterium]
MPDNEMNLRVPGPTPVPDRVANAGARAMVNHRGPEFATSMGEVIQGLKPFFGTEGEPLILTGSGSGAQEAAIVNMVSSGDEILSVTAGVFGDRFASIAQAFGATVHRLQGEWGRAISPDDVRNAVQEHPNIKAVLLTHNETSTGVTNDVEAIASAIRAGSGSIPPVILVDGVSSIGALSFAMDEWGVDVAITGSQKAWMSPPGLSMVAVSERGWRAYAEARMPRFYWDFTKARKNAEKRTTPFTPAVGVLHALQEALRMMHEEGPTAIFERHARIGRHMRDGVASLGLELFAGSDCASDTVTAVRVPAGVDASILIRDLRERGVVVGSGQDWLKGSIFRVGHMGWVHTTDIDIVLDALRDALEGARLQRAV